MLTRRDFLTISAVVVGSGFAPALALSRTPKPDPGLPSPGPQSASVERLKGITKDMFEEVVGSVFVVAPTPTTPSVRLKLARVSEPKSQQANLEQYTLVLRGYSTAELEQGTYEITHKTLGRFCLFLVPGMRDRSGMSYTASFSFLLV